MSDFPEEFTIFDTEFTAWEGSHARGWSNPGEHREIIQIGAIKVDKLKETDSFLMYVKPKKNPELSDYIIKLTGITQADIDTKGVEYKEALAQFHKWCRELPIYSFGLDGEVMKENSELVQILFPFNSSQFHDVRRVFQKAGVDTGSYMSSTIPRAFGVEPPPDAHDALSDARSILLALQQL